MFLTKAQLEEIRRYLATVGVRDTDMPGTESLNGSELVAIVQNGENVTVRIGDLFNKYVTDLAPWVGQGASAFDIWKITYGTSTSTPEDFLDWLQANIIVVDDYSPDPTKSKVASEDEVSRLKTAFDAFKDNTALKKTDIITDSRDIRSTEVGKVVAASIIYQMLQDIEHLKEHGVPGGSVSIYDDLDHETTDEALSANMGHVLNEKIIKLENVNKLLQKIYVWEGEFKGGLPGNTPNDDGTSVANAHTVWQLFQQIQDLRKDVNDIMENGGGSGEGTAAVEYKVIVSNPSGNNVIQPNGSLQLEAKRIMYRNGIPAEDGAVITNDPGCRWYLSWNPQGNDSVRVTVDKGLVKNIIGLEYTENITVVATYDNSVAGEYRVQVLNVESGQEDETREPEIVLTAANLNARGDGKFFVGEDRYEDIVEVGISTKYTKSAWKIDPATLPSSPSWLNYELSSKGIKFSINKTTDEFDARDARIKIYLESDPNGPSVKYINVHQDAKSYDYTQIDLVIMDEPGAKERTFPAAIGGTINLIVQSSGEWRITEKPDFVSLSQIEGPIGETRFAMQVLNGDTDSGYIVCELKDGSKTDRYFVARDASIANSLVLTDEDNHRHGVISHLGGSSYIIKIYASGAWTATIPEIDEDQWLSFSDETLEKHGSATSYTGQVLLLKIKQMPENHPWGRRSYVLGQLDGTSYKFILPIYQFAETGENYFAVFEPSTLPLSGGLTSLRVWDSSMNAYPFRVYLDNGNMPSGFTFPEEYIGEETSFGRYASPVVMESGYNIYLGEHGIYGIELSSSTEERLDISVPIHIGRGGLESNTVYAVLYQTDNQDEGESGVTPITVELEGMLNGGYPYDTTKVYMNVTSSIPVDVISPAYEGVTSRTVQVKGNWRHIAIEFDDVNNTGNDMSYQFTVKPSETGTLVAPVTVVFTRFKETPEEQHDPDIQPHVESYLAISGLSDTASQNTLSFKKNQSRNFQISSSSAWYVKSGTNLDLVDIIPSSGSAYTTTNVSVSTKSNNISGSNKNISITFANSSGDEKTVGFVQLCAPTLTITPNTYEFEKTAPSGSSQNVDFGIEVTSPYDWGYSVRTGNSFVTVSRVGNILTISVPNNTDKEARTASILVTVNGASMVSETITITQKGSSLSATCSKNNFTYNDSSTGTITVVSNDAWVVTSADSFVNITGGSGTGNGSATFSLDESSLTTERTATITVALASHSSVYQTFTITQEGTQVTPRLQILNAETTINDDTPTGDTGVVLLDTNVEWSHVEDSTGSTELTVLSVSGNSLSYSYPENESLSPVTYTITFSGTGVEDVVFTINQAAAGAYLSVRPAANEVSYESGNGSISVLANSAWTAEASNNGISISPSSGNGSGTIDYSYTQNVTESSVDKTITVTANDSGLSLLPATFTLTQNGITIPAVNMYPIPSSSPEARPGTQAFVVTGATDPGSGDGLVVSFYSALKISLPSGTVLPTDFTITVIEKITGVSGGIATSSVTKERQITVGGTYGLTGTIAEEWPAFAPISCDTPGGLLYSATVQFGSSAPYYTDFTTIAPVGKGDYEDPISMSDIKTNFGATYVGGID